MLNNDYFYNDIIRKYIIIFGSVFNNLIIKRNDKTGAVTQVINVPIEYADKEKMLTRVKADPGIDRKDAIILPRMSFDIMHVEYDPSRKVGTMGRISSGLSNTSVSSTLAPVPYNIFLNLYVYVKNNTDGTKIIEQILPFFTPDFTIKANIIPGMQSQDVPIVLNSVNIEDNNTSDSNIADRKILIWVLNFTIKGNFFGPTKTIPVINTIDMTLQLGDGPVQNDMLYDFGIEDVS